MDCAVIEIDKTDYPLHPITEDWADFTDVELTGLRDSIREQGLVTRIVLWRGYIVDGRHRARLCHELGRELKIDDISEKTEEEMIAYVRALNQHRRANTRPLTNAEKQARIKAELKANPGTSNRQIAEKVGADHKTVGSTREGMEATGEIPQFKKTVGKDGKIRQLPTLSSDPHSLPSPTAKVSPPNGSAATQPASPPATPPPVAPAPEEGTEEGPRPSSITTEQPAVRPEGAALTKLRQVAMTTLGRILDFERDGFLEIAPRDVAAVMIDFEADDLREMAPRVIDWIQKIGAALERSH